MNGSNQGATDMENKCVHCGSDAIGTTKLCEVHGGYEEGPGPIHHHPTEKTALKHEAKQLRKMIAKHRRLVQQRQAVENLRAEVNKIQYAEQERSYNLFLTKGKGSR
jgi:hypothetical protein